jgi:hypothetical protein
VVRAGLVLAIVLMTASPLPAEAQDDATAPAATGAPRLGRVATHAEDGRLYGDATIGQLAVTQYGSIWEALRTAKDRTAAEVGLGRVVCGSFTEVVRGTAKALVKAMPKDDRAAVGREDPAAVRRLAIGVLATLDGVAPDAILADEAMGPGVYSDPIAGLVYAFDRCKIL